MGKLNEQLRAALTFDRRELGNHITISTTYKEIYRQYSYFVFRNNINGIPVDYAQLEEEAKNILTMVVDIELSKKYVRCKSCWQHIVEEFEASTVYVCKNCGTVNDIKVLRDNK